ncbi:hypothetical protein JCM13580A_13880 [Streptomyces drozdowiczii]
MSHAQRPRPAGTPTAADRIKAGLRQGAPRLFRPYGTRRREASSAAMSCAARLLPPGVGG